MSEAAFSAVILANGETPTGVALKVLKAASRVIACDGAYVRARALGLQPDYVIGDGDSLPAADRAVLGERFVQVSEQDTNDLAKAVGFAVGQGWQSLAIVGAGGGREDHLIGNVFRLIGFAQRVPTIAMFTNAGRFDVVPITGPAEDGFRCRREFESRSGAAVSVFAPLTGTRMGSQGLQWPLAGVDPTELFSCTLNRATGSSFTICSTHPVIVYRANVY